MAQVTFSYRPYFYVAARKGCLHEVSSFLTRKYSGKVVSVESVDKEDLDLVNNIYLPCHFICYLLSYACFCT